MAIQSSINSLLSQAQNLATFYMGFKKADDFIKGQDDIVKGQKEQTEATKKLQESFENRYKKYKGIPSDVTLNPEQQDIVNIGTELEEGMGRAVDIGGTDSINQAKADFNAHTASLIKKYGKGSENP